MPTHPVSTRWRDIANPISPLDPIQLDGIRYEPGRLPLNVVVLCWDGVTLLGPYRFDEAMNAAAFMLSTPGVTHYLVVPSPTDTYELPEIPGL